MPGIKMCAIVTRGAILFTLFSVSSEIVGLTASAEKQASAKRFAKIEILKTGNDLRETCNGFRELPDIPGSDIPCRNFIRGIYETIVVTDGVTHGNNGLPRSCPGRNVMEPQIYAVVAKWMTQNPEEWDKYAVSIVAQ
jgi:dihydroxyacid dehydratase/phosphogluconate dehydratase